MSEDVDLDKIMADIFGAQTQAPAEQMFYVSYNEMNKILGFGKLERKDDDAEHIVVTRDIFDELSNNTVGNYVVDVENNTVVDIASNQVEKNKNLSQLTEWLDTSIAKLTFIKSTRQLYVNVRTQLPTKRTVWLVPRANYMIPLLTLELQAQQETFIDVPTFNNSNSCQLITDTNIEAFASYREVDNETDL